MSSLSLPANENVRVVVNESIIKVEEIENITLSSNDNSQSTALNPQLRRSSRPHIKLHRLSFTSTSSSSSSTTTIDQKSFKINSRMFTGESKEEILRCKPYKCSMCEYRTGRRANTCKHMGNIHRVEYKQATRLVTELPMDVARQTINMYNEERTRDGRFKRGKRITVNQQPDHQNNFSCKPFKCGLCEYRAAQKSNASSHMQRVHQVESHQACSLVKVLSLNNAKKTLNEYNRNFDSKSGRFNSYSIFNAETKSAASKSGAIV
jgi:hypothetical protein